MFMLIWVVATVVAFSTNLLEKNCLQKHFRILGLKKPSLKNTDLGSRHADLFCFVNMPGSSYLRVFPLASPSSWSLQLPTSAIPALPVHFSLYSRLTYWWDLPRPSKFHLNFNTRTPAPKLDIPLSNLFLLLKYLLLAYCLFYSSFLCPSPTTWSQGCLSVLFPSTNRFSVNIYWMTKHISYSKIFNIMWTCVFNILLRVFVIYFFKKYASYYMSVEKSLQKRL